MAKKKILYLPAVHIFQLLGKKTVSICKHALVILYTSMEYIAIQDKEIRGKHTPGYCFLTQGNKTKQ